MISNSLGYRVNDVDYFIAYKTVFKKFGDTPFRYKEELYQKLKSPVKIEEAYEKLKLPKPLYFNEFGQEPRFFWGFYDVSKQGNPMLLYVSTNEKNIKFTLHSVMPAKKEIAKYGEAFKDRAWTEAPEDKISVSFAQWENGQANTHDELLKCPQWTEIAKNYTHQEELTSILELTEPWKMGKVIILHGKPGCGKTYFIRALMQAWRKLFNYFVIGDPEEFARNPSYYFELASRNKDDDWESDDEGNPLKKKDVPAHSLFIIEDAADLVLKESRQTHYDKIGKLLNITDGLLGQGREDIIFITFNEDINDIDPAFLRPGRCIADLEISSFTMEQANAWLKLKGSNQTVEGPATLAELYNTLLTGGTKKKVPTSRPKFGFGGA